MLLGVFLPGDLHAWLTRTWTTGPGSDSGSLTHALVIATPVSPGNEIPWPRKQTAPLPRPAPLLTSLPDQRPLGSRRSRLKGRILGNSASACAGKHLGARVFAGTHMRSREEE
jgi:hypothetical protein